MWLLIYILHAEKRIKIHKINNNTLNFQLVSGAARPQGSIIKNGRIPNQHWQRYERQMGVKITLFDYYNTIRHETLFWSHFIVIWTLWTSDGCWNNAVCLYWLRRWLQTQHFVLTLIQKKLFYERWMDYNKENP